MTKNTFLTNLERALKKLHVDHIQEILNDYAMHIQEATTSGISEIQAVKSLGDVDSIAQDYYSYQTIHKNNRIFELITSSSYAIPMLIMFYGFAVLFFASTLVSWSLGIYYIFQLDTFAFLPSLMPGINFIFGFMFISFSLTLFSISIKLFVFSKHITKQFFVKKTLRIGNYKTHPIYSKILLYSSLLTISILVISYITSVIITGQWEFWHHWQWFE